MSAERFTSLSGVIPAGLTISLSCAEQQGAALVINRRAIREDTRCGKAFRDLILKNYEVWHSFARDDLQADISVKDIFLVTGNILTHEWATATVVEKTRNCEIQFNAGDGLGPFGGASASMWGSWTSSVSLPLRFGPTSLPPAHSDARPIAPNLSDSYDVTDVRTAEPTESTISDHEETSEPLPNQCIFVRAYRVLLRPFFLRKIKAAAEPKDEVSRGSDEESHYPIAVQVGLDPDGDSETGDDELAAPVSILDIRLQTID